MLLGIIILFGPFIFSDKMLFGSDTINAGVFFRHFYVDYVKTHGTIPVWNPYIFGGLPFVDAFHGDIFYPLSILKFFGNFYRMLGFNLVIHIFLAGLFMFFTARQFKLGRLASSVAAIAYMFSGFLVSLVAPGHDGKIYVTTLFPLTILFLDRAFEKRPILNFTLLGLVIGAIILTPHPQLSYYALWAVAAYGAFKLIVLFRKTKSLAATTKPARLLAAAVAPGHSASKITILFWKTKPFVVSLAVIAKPAFLLTGAVVLGLGISAIQFYPGYIYTTEYSPRADTKRGYDWATSWSMGQEEAFSLIVPEFSGTNSGENNYYWGRNVFKDNSEYAGVIPLFLAFLGVFLYRKKEAIFFGALALFALIYALGGTTPIFKIFYYLIPNVKSLRAPSTIMFIFVFSVSLLAGMAVHYLANRARDIKEKTRKRLLIYLISAPVVLLLFALLFSASGESMLKAYSSIFYSDAPTLMVGQGMSKFSLGIMNLPNVQSGLWIVFLLVGASSAAIYLFLSRRLGVAVLFLIPLLIMIDGIRFDSRFIKTFDHEKHFSSNSLTSYFDRQTGPFRVLNLADRAGVSLDFLPYFGQQVVTGYHGNQLRWYDDLLGGPEQRNKINPRFLNLTNTKYVIVPRSAIVPADYLGEKPLTAEGDFGNVTVYRNDNAFPRAFLVHDYRVIPDRKEINDSILNGADDLLHTVFLEKNPGLPIDSADSATGTAAVIDYTTDSVVIDISSPQNAILVLTDNYYRFWDAYSDSRKLEVLRADGAFRAVPVDAGTERVVFRYNRAGNSVPRAVTGLALLLVAMVLIAHLIRYWRVKKQMVA